MVFYILTCEDLSRQRPSTSLSIALHAGFLDLRNPTPPSLWYQVRLTVWFPLLSDNPIEALIEVMDIRQQASQAVCHLSTTRVCLDCAGLGQTKDYVPGHVASGSQKLTCLCVINGREPGRYRTS